MATGLGILAKGAMQVNAIGSDVYPTTIATATALAVALKKGNLFPLLSESILLNYEHTIDETLEGQAGYNEQLITGILPGGDIEMTGKYLGLDAWIGLAMGWEKPANINANGASPYYLESVAGSGSPLSGDTTVGSVTNRIFDTDSDQFTAGNVGEYARITEAGDAAEGQVRRISAYVDVDELAIVPNWAADPGTGVSYEVAGLFRHVFELSQNLHGEIVDNLYTLYSTHTVGTNTDIINRWGHLVFEKTVADWQWRATMVDSIKFRVNRDGMLVTVKVAPFDLDRADLVAQTPANWAYLAGTYLFDSIRMSDMTFRMDDYSASVALTNTDKLTISEFELTIENNLELEDRGSGSSLYRLAPMRKGKQKVTASITVPRYEADTRLTDYVANTAQMADLIFVGATPTGFTNTLRMEFQMKKFTLNKATGFNVSGSGIIEEKWDLHLLDPAAEPAGMTASTLSNIGCLLIRMTNHNPYNVFRGQNAETT